MNPGLSACEADTLPLSYTPIHEVLSISQNIILHIFCKTFFNTEKQNQKRKILKEKRKFWKICKICDSKKTKMIVNRLRPLHNFNQSSTNLSNRSKKSKSLNLSVDPEKNCTYVQSWFPLSFQQCTKSKWIRMWRKLQK